MYEGLTLSAYEMGALSDRDDIVEYYEDDLDYGYLPDGRVDPGPCSVCDTAMYSCVGVSTHYLVKEM